MIDEDKEIFEKLETIINDSTEFFNFVPVSSMISVLWEKETYKVPVICVIGKAMMRMQVNGKSFEEIKTHFVDSLQIEHDFAANCYNCASIAAPYCADIMDGILTREEAVAKVAAEYEQNSEIAEPMVEALMSLTEFEAMPEFCYEKPEDITEKTPLKMDLHRQLAEFYFEEGQRPLVSLVMALAQDYIDGTPIKELRSSLYKDLGPQADGIIENVREVSEQPQGVWISVMKEIRSFTF